MKERRRLAVWGAVQGVGFRPFACLLARQLGLSGFVSNSSQGATVEIEGESELLDRFVARLALDLPPPGSVAGLESVSIPLSHDSAFDIRESQSVGPKTALILPDIAPCPKCLAEIRDPGDRRFGYPFANCTHCGPRYSIVRSLPYDRPNTAMAGFPLCPQCRSEYENPEDRRYHAQPTACAECGPNLAFWDSAGGVLATRQEALLAAADRIRDGAIVAIKGVGGFHLAVDARNQEAVERLRARKRREAKPLAVMVPSIEAAMQLAELDPRERELLLSYAAPIVILRSKGSRLADSVAPENPNLGLMLPSSPLHALLMDELGFPIVATSGNLSDEPICTDEHEALVRLGDVADWFLVHDRPIVRPIDDSVCRMLGEGPAVLRRARGYAPLPFAVPGAEPGLLATGAHMKGSVAVTGPGCVIVGQHIGDLDHARARERLREECEDLAELFESPVRQVIHDLHPDYGSTVYARSLPVPVQSVQHHVAHAAAVIGEHELEGDVLAVVWDGTGLGPDQTIWGGEFLLVRGSAVKRVASLRPFPLPGGDAASREGFRAAWGALFAAFGEEGFTLPQQPLHPRDSAIQSLLRTKTRCVETTSAGRLFDAAACLGAGIALSRFEGDAAMRWEAIAAPEPSDAYPIALVQSDRRLLLDWAPVVGALARDGRDAPARSARFHQALANGIVLVAQAIAVSQVALTGGCFQNRKLSDLACQGLRGGGHDVFEHRRIPPNDGGIAFGQAVAAIRGLELASD